MAPGSPSAQSSDRWYDPQKSSFSRSQFAACANMRASVYLPTPFGPVVVHAAHARSEMRHAVRLLWAFRKIQKIPLITSHLSRSERPALPPASLPKSPPAAASTSAARRMTGWWPTAGCAKAYRTFPQPLPDDADHFLVSRVLRWCSREPASARSVFAPLREAPANTKSDSLEAIHKSNIPDAQSSARVRAASRQAPWPLDEPKVESDVAVTQNDLTFGKRAIQLPSQPRTDRPQTTPRSAGLHLAASPILHSNIWRSSCRTRVVLGKPRKYTECPAAVSECSNSRACVCFPLPSIPSIAH